MGSVFRSTLHIISPAQPSASSPTSSMPLRPSFLASPSPYLIAPADLYVCYSLTRTLLPMATTIFPSIGRKASSGVSCRLAILCSGLLASRNYPDLSSWLRPGFVQHIKWVASMLALSSTWLSSVRGCHLGCSAASSRLPILRHFAGCRKCLITVNEVAVAFDDDNASWECVQQAYGMSEVIFWKVV